MTNNSNQIFIRGIGVYRESDFYNIHNSIRSHQIPCDLVTFRASIRLCQRSQYVIPAGTHIHIVMEHTHESLLFSCSVRSPDIHYPLYFTWIMFNALLCYYIA